MNSTSSATGRVTTFYSYKGGTGRSMLLANIAWLLAASGRRVLMVDWDLEAPGLHRYFAPFLVDPELSASDGLIDMVIDYASAAVEPNAERDVDWYHEYADVLKYTVSIDWPFPSGGSLCLFPAGRQGATYAARTNTFNWQHFYDKLGGYGFMEAVKHGMRTEFSEILIDSRTGVSDTSGICTVQMPDQLVACFTLNNQSIEGTAAIARSVLAQRNGDFNVYPVPTRIDNSEVDRLRERWGHARERFQDLPQELSDGATRDAYWDEIQIPYIPKYAYEEVLAPLANLPSDPKNINLLACVQGMARQIFGVTGSPDAVSGEHRRRILEVYAGRQTRQEAAEVARDAGKAQEELKAKYEEKVATLERELDRERVSSTGRGKAHAYVAMPFGIKPGSDGQRIDFNRVYAEYVRPSLEAAGLEAFRADGEQRAGDIRTDMFQELLVADLVLADLTADNPNVWYELGVRHALRARGVVLVSGGRVATAFDLYTDRKLRYGLKDGAPDPATIEDDKRRLTEMVKATMDSWHGRTLSPVYHLMPNLQEPDWKRLRIGDVREFWEQHDAWEDRMELARRAGRIGDLLVLADEAPVAAFRAEAWIKAGVALRQAERFDFALEQLERGLEIEPEHLRGLREKGICLQRLALAGATGHSLDRARAHYRRVLERYPNDPETWALLGRVDKDAWIAAWRRPGLTPEQMREEAAYEDVLLRAAIESYQRIYRESLGHYYSGINAVTLMYLYRHLTGDARYDREMAAMAGAVRFAAECEPDERQFFWPKVTLGDLEVLVGTPDTVKAAYKEAIARNEKDWFALNSSRAQLQWLNDLGFRPETVEAGIATFERALQKLARPEDRWQPRQVFLFSGHMVDAPDRATPRFPAEKVPIAAQKIAEALDQLGASDGDLALSQAAAGGDLLFVEACRERGVRCQILLPFPEPEFIQRSVLPSADGDQWRQRFYAMKTALKDPARIMPDELGPLPKGVDPYERCNLWLLYTALACGVDKVRFVCLWDGGGGDGTGGTEHMYGEVKRRTGGVTWLDTRRLS